MSSGSKPVTTIGSDQSCDIYLFKDAAIQPRHAAIEPTGSGEKFARLIEGADIIYFPSESVALDSRSEAAWKLLEAVRRSAPSFALGWDLAGNDAEHREFLAEAGRSGWRNDTPTVAR